jgi:hypothetical protein
MFAQHESTFELAIKTVITPTFTITEFNTSAAAAIRFVTTVVTTNAIKRIPTTASMTFFASN